MWNKQDLTKRDEHMTKVEVERTIIEETREMSVVMLHEVLDFVQFLKTRQEKRVQQTDLLSMLPKHQLGEVQSSLRREDIYTDAR